MDTSDNQMLIKKMLELALNTKNKIEVTSSEFKNYLEYLNYEKFEEFENETEEDAIKRAESIYDRLDEMRRRNQIVLKNGNETISLIDNIKLKIGSVIKQCENDQILLTRHNDKLIYKIIELEERKLDKEIEPFDIQIQELEKKIEIREESFNNKKEEWQKQIINQMIGFEEIEQLESWSGMKIGNIIFDSNNDDCKEGTSVFDQKVINKSNLIFLIEDDEGNKFGGYVNAKIVKCKSWINDSKSFVFSLKSNGRLNGMFKFDVTDSQHAFRLCDQSEDLLFEFGFGSDYTFMKSDSSDISILKQKISSLSGFSDFYSLSRTPFSTTSCHQHSYNYEGIKNALCGTTDFNMKRMTVIQLN